MVRFVLGLTHCSEGVLLGLCHSPSHKLLLQEYCIHIVRNEAELQIEDAHVSRWLFCILISFSVTDVRVALLLDDADQEGEYQLKILISVGYLPNISHI